MSNFKKEFYAKGSIQHEDVDTLRMIVEVDGKKLRITVEDGKIVLSSLDNEMSIAPIVANKISIELS